MKRLAKKHLLAVVLILMTLVLLSVYLIKRPVVTMGFQSQEITHFARLETLLNGGIHPTTSYAAASVSTEAISSLFETVRGIEANYAEVPDVTLRIDRLVPMINQGQVGTQMRVTVMYQDVPVYANIVVDGYLLTRSIRTAEYGSNSVIYEVIYGIAIGSINMYLSNQSRSIQRPQMSLDTLLPALNNLIRDIEFSFPIALPAEVQLELSSRQSVAMGDGSFEFETSMPRLTLDLSSTFLAASIVPASRGIWLILFDGRLENSTSSLRRSSEGLEEGGERLRSLRARVNQRVSEFPEIDQDVAVYINQPVLRSIAEMVNTLPTSQREIRATLVSQSGHLWKEGSTLLGQDGEVSLRFTGPDSATASARFGQLSYDWIEESGVSMKATTVVSASATLTLRVDPYIGGGVSVDFAAEGEASIPFEMTLDVRKINLEDGSSGIVGGPVLKCKQFEIKFTTGETLELGMITHQYIGKDQIDPQVLISSNSVYWFSPSKALEKSDSVSGASKWIGIRFKPNDVYVDENGYVVYADIETFFSDHRVESGKDVEITEKALSEGWVAAVKQKCPERSVGKVLIAGEDFGPNNVLVKVLSSILSSVDDSLELVKLTWRDLEQIKDNPEDTPKILTNFFNRSLDVAKRALRTVGGWLGIN